MREAGQAGNSDRQKAGNTQHDFVTPAHIPLPIQQNWGKVFYETILIFEICLIYEKDLILSTTNRPPSKRDRTRRQLLDAAGKVFASRGFEASTIQEIAAVAGVANGTFYNYFPTKEAILEAAAIQYGVKFCERIDASYRHIQDGAERMAIGGKNYLMLAVEQPDMARFVMSVALASPTWDEQVRPFIMADLLLGLKQKRFQIASKDAAMDLIMGTNFAAIRSILDGRAGRSHITATAASILRGLGMTPKDADEIAKRPLPPLPPATM